MSLNRFILRRHLATSAWASHLFNAAWDIGFKKKGKEEDQYPEETLFALRVAKIEKLSDVDDFIHKNFELIQQFLIELKNSGSGEWTVNDFFLYELMVLLKEPHILNETYVIGHGWSETTAGSVQYALNKYAPHMVR
ncbi:TPA: hypothetical protein ACN7XQ_003231 [Klebsiella pneumoniae]